MASKTGSNDIFSFTKVFRTLRKPLPEKVAQINQLQAGKCWHACLATKQEVTTFYRHYPFSIHLRPGILDDYALMVVACIYMWQMAKSWIELTYFERATWNKVLRSFNLNLIFNYKRFNYIKLKLFNFFSQSWKIKLNHSL